MRSPVEQTFRLPEWLFQVLWSGVGVGATGAIWYFLSVHEWIAVRWTVIATLGLTLFTIVLSVWNNRRAWTGVQIERVKSFKPAQIVGAFDAGTTEYLPINADPDVRSLLSDGQDILITGRPGIGKSHTAIGHIKRDLQGWFIVRPGRNELQVIASAKFRRRNYVLLLDDLDEYVPDREEITTVLDAVDNLRNNAKRLIVVATLRSTVPEFNTLAMIPKLSGRWKVVELQDWTEKQGETLARLTGSALTSWDGTPLSVKRPSREMQVRYEQAPPEQRQLLALIRALHDRGIRPIRLKLLERLIDSSDSKSNFTPIVDRVETLKRLGFLKRDSAEIEAYAPYLETVKADELAYNRLVDVLCELQLLPELIRLAQHFVDGGGYANAVEIYERAIELEPLQERLHYRLGIALSMQDKLPEAIFEFDRATQLSPGWASAWWRLSALFTRQGLGLKAAKAFAQVKDASRLDSPTRRCLRVSNLRAAGFVDEASREIEDVISMSPELSLAWFESGRVLSDKGDNHSAIRSFQRALDLDSTLADAHFGIARPLRQTGDAVGAERAYRESIRLRPALPEAHSFLATLLMESGRMDEAEQEIKTAIALSPSTPEFHSYYGQLLGRRRDPAGWSANLVKRCTSDQPMSKR